MIQNELFSLGNYSAPARSKRKKYSAYAADPAWEDGTAYPEIAKTNFDDNDGLISGINQECDRSQENNTACAFLEETAKTSDGDDENECERSQENNTACAFLEETSDISDDDRSQENHTVSVFLEETSDISDDDH
ncbi:MAG: hypothetical protein KME46_33720, partial [Brasilonema angustatum HA4187-MV1]|nr:hypothetical protein [Brasilonema angustatum HA4187-MV1]